MYGGHQHHSFTCKTDSQGLLLANDELCAFLSKEEGRTFTDSLCEDGMGYCEGRLAGTFFHTCAAPETEISVGHFGTSSNEEQRSADGASD